MQEPYKPDDYPQPFSISVPPRTVVLVTARATLTHEEAEALKRGDAHFTKDLDLTAAPAYTCQDCGFATREYADALEHQDRQASYHNWSQRLRRWWQTNYFPLGGRR